MTQKPKQYNLLDRQHCFVACLMVSYVCYHRVMDQVKIRRHKLNKCYPVLKEKGKLLSVLSIYSFLSQDCVLIAVEGSLVL